MIKSSEMQSVLHSFAYGIDFLADQVAGVSDTDMVAQPAGIANHPAWTIGHLTHVCQQLGSVLGLFKWLPDDWADLYGTGSVPFAEATKYPSGQQALATLRDAQQRLTSAVEKLDDSRLDMPFPEASYLDVFPTIRHAIVQVLVGHSAYHIGQVGVWRRAMGLAPLGRSFE